MVVGSPAAPHMDPGRHGQDGCTRRGLRVATRGIRGDEPVVPDRAGGAQCGFDWQVQVTAQGTLSIVAGALARTPGVRTVLPVNHAQIPSLTSTSGRTTRSTGAASLAQTASGPVNLTVDGVVDLPRSDSFFQVMGAPAGVGATAPPDNVVLVPAATFTTLSQGSTVVHQFHVLLDRS